jgi:uncharacterized membrane protein
VSVRAPDEETHEPAATSRPRRTSLLTRVLVLNAAVIIGAFLFVALTPVTVSAQLTAVEGLALGLIIAGALAANVVAVRQAFAPLRRLTAVMRGIGPARAGRADRGPRRSQRCARDQGGGLQRHA